MTASSLKRLFLSLIIFTSPALADLNIAQRGFLTHYLGLSSREANLKFEVKEEISDDALFTGETHPTDSRKIKLFTDNDSVNSETSAIYREGTLVHEAIHLYYYRSKPQEEKWAQEGIALLGEFLYDLEKFGKAQTFQSFSPLILSAGPHLAQTQQNFQANPESYGDAFLFFLFVYSSFQGEDFSSQHLRVTLNGLDGVSQALNQSKSARLTPSEWKLNSNLMNAYSEALLKSENPLATSAHDLFQQCLSLRAPQNGDGKK